MIPESGNAASEPSTQEHKTTQFSRFCLSCGGNSAPEVKDCVLKCTVSTRVSFSRVWCIKNVNLLVDTSYGASKAERMFLLTEPDREKEQWNTVIGK